ncbi:inositol monophosphatase family protein [Desulfatiglans anilini]|uniref:inositol monophosphatase family protein n=1 Tax=Desulfatiglans anilini TaxID=90728 RepID=UPI00040AB96B|nr:inositol monophosphatase family protein [Desulfatiglans anilini]
MTAKAQGPSIVELADFAMDIARKAGNEALPFYGEGAPQIKFDESLVTKAELHLESLLRSTIIKQFPQHRIFKGGAPEEAYTHDEKRYVWVYDALDGISNFQAGIPIWAVSIALLENFWPVLGVCFLPATGDLFHAVAGQEAYLGNRALSKTKPSELNDESVLFTYSRFHQHYVSSFPGKIRNLGCTVAHMCYVANGRADAALIAHETYANLAAARVIVEAAGKKIFHMDGSSFVFDGGPKEELIGSHLLVADPEIAAEVLQHLQNKAA